MKFTPEETYKFVELYRNYECLWNVKDTFYINRAIRKAAQIDLAQEMNKLGFGIEEVKQKIKNLRATYNQECAKIQKSRAIDREYVPNMKWFSMMHDMLKEGIAAHNNDNEPLENVETVVLEIKDETEEWSVDELQNAIQHEASSQIYTIGKERDGLNPASQQYAEERLLNELQAIDGTRRIPSQYVRDLQEESTNGNTSILLANRGNKRRLDEPTGTFEDLNNMHQTSPVDDSNMNDNDAFGKFVASSLNQLTPIAAVVAQSEIQAVLTKYRLASLQAASSSNITNTYAPFYDANGPSNDQFFIRIQNT